jgi:hypothetical protein
MRSAYFWTSNGRWKSSVPALPCKFAVVAGNHDCYFGSSTATPPGSIPANMNLADPVAALANYFDFTRTLPLSYDSHNASSPFFTYCDFGTTHGLLRLLLVNTSVFSKIHEQPGSLSIPVEQLTARIDPPAQYVVTMVHHPWNWFAQPEIMRPLRDRIECLSDVILTGHEHSPETADITRNERIRALYIAGGVLQDDDPANSSFVTIKLDLQQKTRATATFRYMEAGFYKRESSTDAKVFVGNLARLGRPFELREEFRHRLDDLGFVIHHPRKQSLTLSDVFVYPDLLIVDEPATDGPRQLRSRDVAQKLLAMEKVLISGGEKSGKTCLANSLFRSAYGAGRLPLLLNGKEIQSRKTAGFREILRRAVRDQYQNLSADQFEQQPRESRVVIVDDFTAMVDSAEVRNGVLEELEQVFSCVIVLANETYCFNAVHTQEAKNLHVWQYDHYNILSFGEVLREQFIRRWLSLAPEPAAPLDLHEETDRLVKLINGVIKTTLLPCYPLFLMIVLQQAQAGQPTVRGGHTAISLKR